VTVIYGFSVSYVLLLIIDKTLGLGHGGAVEREGLDISLHGESLEYTARARAAACAAPAAMRCGTTAAAYPFLSYNQACSEGECAMTWYGLVTFSAVYFMAVATPDPGVAAV